MNNAEEKEEKYVTIFENRDHFTLLGIHIAYYRKQKNFTQQKLANRLGISRSYLNRIESPNLEAHISFQRFFTITRILDVPSACFFEPLPEQELNDLLSN